MKKDSYYDFVPSVGLLWNQRNSSYQEATEQPVQAWLFFI